MNPWIWERKYEVDSLCYPIQLAYKLYKKSGYSDHFNDAFGLTGLISAFTIAYALALQYSVDPLSVGSISLSSYLMSTSNIIGLDDSTGMSTSLLVTKMEEAANNKGLGGKNI